jgi:hypothetical protein
MDRSDQPQFTSHAGPRAKCCPPTNQTRVGMSFKWRVTLLVTTHLRRFMSFRFPNLLAPLSKCISWHLTSSSAYQGDADISIPPKPFCMILCRGSRPTSIVFETTSSSTWVFECPTTPINRTCRGMKDRNLRWRMAFYSIAVLIFFKGVSSSSSSIASSSNEANKDKTSLRKS